MSSMGAPLSLNTASTEARSPKHFFGTFLGTPFGAGTFRSTFSALLSGQGFGTSVAGRQDCHFRGFSYFRPLSQGAALWLCDLVGLLQESERPLPRKFPKKSEKVFRGTLGRRVEEAQKMSKRAENEPNEPSPLKKLEKLSHFRLFFEFYFVTPGPRGSGNPFL